MIIPAFNAIDHIRQVLQPGPAQGCPASEVIVADDGSYDDAGLTVEGFAETELQVQPIQQQGAGIRAARGKYIAPQGGDGLWFLEDLEIPCALMKSCKRVCGKPRLTKLTAPGSHTPSKLGFGHFQVK